MGKVIRVTPEELDKAAKSMADISETYTDIYTQLLQEASTMGGAWEGEDNLAFVEQINGFCDDLQAMTKKLQLASEALNQQKGNYATRQESNIAQVKKLAN